MKGEKVGCVGPPATEVIEAVVTSIIPLGRNGKGGFLVAYPIAESATPTFTTETSITCSLKCWKGNKDPEAGQIVRLSEILRFSGGWRAQEASPVAYS